MERVEAYHILASMWNDANAEQREALDIATKDIEFVDLMPGYFEPLKHGRWEPHYDGNKSVEDCSAYEPPKGE